MMIYRLGTRRSDLALTQSRQIQNALAAQGISCELIELDSSGDKNREHPLYQMEDTVPGLFTKQLEDALLAGEIDLAVHSLKDVPTRLPKGLKISAIPPRESNRDVLIFSPAFLDRSQPLSLKQGTLIGTSSLRREAQLWTQRKDLIFKPIRGNVPTRIEKVRKGEYGGTVLAEAGLRRLGLKLEGLESLALDPEVYIPAPGQGALAVETRAHVESPLADALKELHDPLCARATEMERLVLRGLDGGCTLPLGVYARSEDKGKHWKLRAFLGRSAERGERRWLGADTFDISGSDDQNLVAQTVAYFKK